MALNFRKNKIEMEEILTGTWKYDEAGVALLWLHCLEFA